ncbi:MAG: AraC family transcriptional regulator [Clostridia bacterium]|nr:AraC family transcriptional regulator [Clostridia bacterium]
MNINPYIRYASKSRYIINNKILTAYDCHILYVISGNGMFESEGRYYPLSSGTLIFYPYGTPYRVSQEEENNMLFYTINFDLSYDFKNVPPMMPVLSHNYSIKQILKSMDTETEHFFSKIIYIPVALWAEEPMKLICSEMLDMKSGYEQIQTAYMKIVLLNLYRYYYDNKSDNSLCEEIKKIISKNISLNNQSIARIVNYHPYYINDVFKKHEGMTLHKYILHQRMIKAYELVSTTTLGFEEIANLCGFSSYSHMLTTFKKTYKITPAKIRKKT